MRTATEKYIVVPVEWTQEEKKAWAHGLSVLLIEMFLEQDSRQQPLPSFEKKEESKYDTYAI
jgi:hypothetical protein